MIFFLYLLLYSIFFISFSQEEQIQDFWHLLRIRSLRMSYYFYNVSFLGGCVRVQFHYFANKKVCYDIYKLLL